MPGLRGPGRPGRRRVRRPGRLGRTRHPGPGPGGRRAEAAGWPAAPRWRAGAHLSDPYRDAASRRGGRRNLPLGGLTSQGRRQAARAAGTVCGRPDRGPQPYLQHRAHRRTRAVLHARRGGDHNALRAVARGIPWRPPAHRFPGPRRRALPGQFADLPQCRRGAASRIPARDDHPLAARGTGVWEVAIVADHIILQVTRYRPERESEPTTQEYEIPLHEEWAVLDGLNHVKDQLDGTLSYRWSCRMGICGSCGMTVNGEPRLTCATFLTDYRPGPIRIEPLRNFPLIRDLVVEIGDFMRKLPQAPAEMDDYKQYSMCINCMLCYSACPIVGLEEGFLGPAVIALAQRYNLDSRDKGADERLDVLSTAEGVWGCTFVGECTTACPKGVDPAGAIQQYKLTAATESLKSFLLPWRSP